MKKYQQIKWKDDPQAPPLPAINQDPLWAFHQALFTRAAEKKQERSDQTLWALAIVKSLIEVRLNKPFMVDAIAAFGKDLATGAYYANGSLPNGETKYSRNSKQDSQFMRYRNATGNAASGDEYKGHVLRTSWVKVSNIGPAYERPSNDLWVTFKDEKGIDGYMRPYLDAWQTMQTLSKTDRDDCLDAFLTNIKVYLATGCVNERSGTALMTMLAKVTEKTVKQLQRKDLIKELAPLNDAWGEEDMLKLNQAFEQLFAKYQGYTFYENKMEGNHFVINSQEDPQWPILSANKEKLRAEVIKQLSIVSGDSENDILAKWMTPIAAATASGGKAGDTGTPDAGAMPVNPSPAAAPTAALGAASVAGATKITPVLMDAGPAAVSAAGVEVAAPLPADAKKIHPQFRWTPWPIVDADAKPPAGVTLQISHDTTAYRTQRAKRLRSSAAEAESPPKVVKENKEKMVSHDFFHDKVAIIASASHAAHIMFTPSGLASVTVEGRVTAAEEVNLGARLIPSTRALLMLAAQFPPTVQENGHANTAKYVANYFNATLQNMVGVRTKAKDSVFYSATYVACTIPFWDAAGKPYLFMTEPATGKTILLDDALQSYPSPSAVNGIILPLKDKNIRQVVRVSAAVWQTQGQTSLSFKAFLSPLIKGEDAAVHASLSRATPGSVGLSRSLLLSTAELAAGQQYAQDAKVFSAIRSDDLQATAQGSGVGPFASMPPLTQITAEFKDLFNMSAENLEILLAIPKEHALMVSPRKNYQHWLTKYALEGSAHQSCSANLILTNILLYKIIKQNPEEYMQTMLMQLMQCFDLYANTWITIAETFVELQAQGKNHGFTLLADLQKLGDNIQTVTQLFPAESLQGFAHRVSQFTGLLKAVNGLITANPTLAHSVAAAKKTQASLAVLPPPAAQVHNMR